MTDELSVPRSVVQDVVDAALATNLDHEPELDTAVAVLAELLERPEVGRAS